MAVVTMREALNQALREEMLRDENVFLMGEEVGEYQGAYKVTKGLLEELGPKRVIDTPITELGLCGSRRRRRDGWTSANRRVHDFQLFDSCHRSND